MHVSGLLLSPNPCVYMRMHMFTVDTWHIQNTYTYIHIPGKASISGL